MNHQRNRKLVGRTAILGVALLLLLVGLVPFVAAETRGVNATAATTALLFDRGLPATNLNAPAGANRSNVTWQSDNAGGNFVGDDFQIGSVGETYRIDSLTVWGAQFDPLSDDINNITLWLGKATDPSLTAVSTGNVTGNTNDNPDISHSFVTYADGVTSTYFATNAGAQFPIAQTTFSNLNLVIEGGTLYNFGISAQGTFGWFGHASNAALGGVTADGADGFVKIFDNTGVLLATVESGPSTGDPFELVWDKSSDMNVQVEAELLEPIANLGLTSLCTDDPTKRVWRVTNPNAFDVDYQVQLQTTTDATPNRTAPPGTSFFETVAVGGPNTTKIVWDNELGQEKQKTQAASNKLCASITIIKSADPADNTVFDFTGPAPFGSFSLQDPDNPSITNGGFNVTTGTQLVEIEELVPSGWQVTDIVCDGDVNGNTSVDKANGTASIVLDQNDIDGTTPAFPAEEITCTFYNEKLPPVSACPVDDPDVGTELTDLFGIGMGSPKRQSMMRKLTVPNAGDVVELYAQMAAKEYTAVRYVRFIFGDKSYVQVQPETDLGEKAAISWWGADITTEFQSQNRPYVKGRWFLNKGMRKMKVPRAFVLYPTYQTVEEYANTWSTFTAPDNFVAGTPGFDQTNTNFLSIPELQVATDVTVELAVTDVNRDPRTIDVTVSAGGVSQTVTLTGPTSKKSELLNIFTVTLENVPAGTDQVEILMESVLDEGDSAALLGAAAHYACESANGNP